MKRYLFIASVIACILLLVMSVISLRLHTNSQAISQQSPIIIENETVSLKILSAKIEAENQEIIRVKVRNIGDKSVLCYHIRYGDDLIHGTSTDSPDFSSLLKKGETSHNDVLVPVENARTKDGVLRLNLSLCMFEDLSAEGDWNLAQQQREQYEGMVIAYKASHAEMEALIDSPQLDLAAFNATLNKISQLNMPTGLTEMQKVGFQFGVQRMQRLISNVTKNGAQSKAGTDRIWQIFKERAIGVRSFSKRMGLRTETGKGGITQ
ncbi:MAG: hypothetical protein SF097_16905 [Acidobacteriota bacterium]|nr:hypothetical protein [Acidobacteriota bacterium]